VAVELEIAGHALSKYARREGPERFAELDLLIHRRLHGLGASIAKDAARAQRPRTELHPSLEPADYVLLVDQSCNPGRQLARVQRAVGGAAFNQECLDLLIREGRSQERASHAIASRGRDPLTPQHGVPNRQRGPDGASRVSGCGLDPDALKRAFPENSPVAHAIERDSPGKTQIVEPRHL